MKIIDLLNKIANGEEVPKKIKFGYKKFEFIGGAYEDEKGKDLCYYYDSCMAFLTDEVKILEENNKINKYNTELVGKRTERVENIESKIRWLVQDVRDINDKINEIIDKLNEMENNNE